MFSEDGEVLEIICGIPLKKQLSPGTYRITEFTTKGNLFSYEIVIVDPWGINEVLHWNEKQTGKGCTAACLFTFPVIVVMGAAFAFMFMKQKGKQLCA